MKASGEWGTGKDGRNSEVYDGLKAAGEPCVFLRLYASGNEEGYNTCDEMREGVLIPLSVIEKLIWFAERVNRG